ncbi:serine/threonine-protein kinase [Streptomyces sp. NPDC020681]|uniref:serine/threonine-protein kinase n=1 Tax=Streptomyces sp. NPDC020681 TaxID=3365083 RepID=UPI00378BC008
MTSGESERLAGRYRVIEQLGRGGMGVVWRAVDEVLGREVAVKELRTYSDSSGPELADLRVRMQREARAAARVRHPSVIAVHDVTEHQGRPVIVMELIDGPSLDDVLGERGTLDPREAASIGSKVMEALGAAHRVGVLHRDVKPGNVLLDRGGRVVLTDFGIAAMDDPGDGSTTHLTRSGELVGSLDYLAPERAQGQEPGPASDIWALGATLYAAVEGAAPFRRTSTWSTLNAIVVEPLPEPRLAGPLAPVLQLLMHKDPAQRPDADTAARLLATVAAGEDTGTVPLGPVQPAQTPQPPAPDPATRVPTVLNAAPHRPEGFGPAVPHNPVPEPMASQAPAHVPVPTPAAASGGRGSGRMLIAAAVAAVLIAGGGVTYLLVDRGPSSNTGLAGDEANSPAAKSSATKEPGASLSGGKQSPSTKPSGKDATKSPPPVSEPPANGAGTGGSDTGGSTGESSTGGGSTTTTGGGSTGGSSTTGGSTTTGGGSTNTTGGGSDPVPEPVCHAIGGGKYNCTVWKTANSYTASGTQVGVLNAGTNYFYCQSNLGRRETSGQWTNVWWAKTDDDSGNTNVWFSDVYIKGGDNDQPVPGLPVC